MDRGHTAAQFPRIHARRNEFARTDSAHLRSQIALPACTPAATDKHVVIIIAVNERNIGILVDTVSDILHVDSAHIQPVPETQSTVDQAFINGLISLENRMVVLLNIDALFNLQELEHSMPLS